MNDILKNVAKQYNTTEKEVEEAIKKVIADAMNSPDPEAQKMWAKICENSKGSTPTPTEVIQFISSSLEI